MGAGEEKVSLIQRGRFLAWKRGSLYGKETPSSNLISHHEQTNLIFPENEKRLAKTLVPMFLCLKHLSLK